jgi:hypothetical protein
VAQRPVFLRACGGGFALLVSVTSSQAHADGLRDVATRVETAWRSAGGTVVRRDTRFVMEDDTTTLDLRPAPTASEDVCRRVALIGARGMSFHVTAAADSSGNPFRVGSVAGVLELSGCSAVPDFVKVKSDSGRGALEVVIATAVGSLPAASTILLERTGGVLPAPAEPGPLPPLLPPGARASMTEERLSREGLAIRPELTWSAGMDGRGAAELTLDEGCHRFDLFAVEPHSSSGRHLYLDLDGALRRIDGEVLAEDQSIAPDVHLETCVGVLTKVNATFEGAPRGSSVVVTHAFRPIPTHVPRVWGSALRARLASVILAHQLVGPSDDAIVLAQGAAGPTPIPIELEPGACYVAVAALEHGRTHGHGLSVRAFIGERVAEDEHGAKEDAAIVAFCARDAEQARIEVDTRSSGAAWGVAVFRMSGGAWDAER